VRVCRWQVWLVLLGGVTCFSALAAESRRPTNAEIFFRLANPCPSTGDTHGACPGYVIDRIIPSACGGGEEPANMQWQTLAQAKEKDRWERIGCRRGRKLVLPGASPSVTESFPVGDSSTGVEAQSLPPEPKE
jgi:hypothetical protein